jgi:hypothetical protein
VKDWGRSIGIILVMFVALAVLGGLDGAKGWGEDSFIKEKKGDDAKKGPEEPDDGLKPFDEVVKGCEKIDGLFPIYRNRDLGKLYMEIPADRFGRPYICAVTREAAEGVFFDNSAMLDDYIFVLRREGKKIRWEQPNLTYFAPGDSAFARAIDRGSSPGLVGVMELASRPHPDTKAILVDPSPIFLQDYEGVGFALRETQSGYALDRDGSYVDAIKNFPRNTEIDIVLTFRTDSPKVPMPGLPDWRNFQHRYRWSLVERPSDGFRPRLADDRVGHFLVMRMDYSNTRSETPYVRYINRWNLQKKDPAAPVSEPKEPIVFWIENTVPPEYRDAVRRGLLNWNPIFEAAGFRNAIEVRQMPDTASWDPADVRYHVIRWMLQPGGTYASGPSRTDPLTGEVYDADIRVAADITRVVYEEWVDQASPLSGLEGRGPGRNGIDLGVCDLAQGLANQAAFGIGLLSARGLFDPDSPEGKRYLDEYIEGLICHEVGHTLGLRHNFKGSMINTLDQLQDKTRTDACGISGSIMDYVPVNLARKGERQGSWWDLKPGPYDAWAIEYAYRPIDAATPEDELPELQRIASRASEPLLAYGTDEDARGSSTSSIDPTCTLFDLGDDPISWCTERMDLSDELWSRMDSVLTKPGQRYSRYRVMFSQGMREYSYGGSIVSKFVGGVYHRRDHVGDPGGRLPFEPVPAATQRRALKVLADRIFSEKAFQFPPDFLNKIAPEMMPDFEGTIWRTQRVDPPLHAMILRAQVNPLARLYDPITLSRIQDAEPRFAAGTEPFRMVEMFQAVRGAIWSELPAGRPIGAIRRNLQRAHLNRLIDLAMKPEAGTPEDATTLARADLKAILKGCTATLGRTDLDPMTRAHLEETKDRISATLDAPIVRQMPDPAAGPRG